MTALTDKPSVALVSAPWAIFSRPSIQLGSLKSYAEHHSDIQVAGLHLYLDIARAVGVDNYNRIAANGWAGEAVFSALLFPEIEEKSASLFRESLGPNAQHLPPFPELVETVREACRSYLLSADLERFTAIGFSVCFYQLLASLYLAGEIKKLPSKPVVIFGGSSCGGELGQSLLDSFGQIDYVVDGEGEIPFTSLCEYLLERTRQFPRRVLSRKQQDDKETSPSPLIADIGDLPLPDYREYFKQTGILFPDTPFIPTLPLEFSRGCWWNKCTFCNLNLQWRGYRWKSSDKMIEELSQLAGAHQCLDYTFTDNALPPREASAFFKKLKSSTLDFRFFAEIRAVTGLEILKEFGEAGLRTIQVGIEAFSSALLQKMKKGVSVIENIAIMKYAAACSIVLEGNLILEFPGSTEEEVNETLSVLDYLLPFAPLSTAAFFLGYHSPVYDAPQEYGITRITHHRNNKMLFPDDILDQLVLISMGCHGDRTYQRKIWKPVREKVRIWQQFHEKRTRALPPLSYRDGGSFIIIRQEQHTGPPLQHRLKGTSRKIYLFCEEIRTLEEIGKMFPAFKEAAIIAFIDQLCTKRLMFRENDRVISLAIRQP